MEAASTGPSHPYKTFWKRLIESSSSGKAQKKIKIQGKDLSSPSLEVFSFEDMQILNMSPERESCLAYQMNCVPKQIGRLMNLTALYMDTNDLEEIPPDVGTLRNLRRLALSNNFLDSLPSELSRLPNLQSLHLANNNFKDFPSVICQLRNLTFLDVSDNQIETIPAAINQLGNVETFLFAFNCLKRLPEEFCLLTKLRCLWLGHNDLRELPKGFGNLTLLDWGQSYCSLNFEGNPLQHPPTDICSGGPHKIKEYFGL
ncbi:leucine-rich repeat protein SHOC-2-like [Spea bombifrons]|uniref:leucine-rich repeat protein SHOC-2-like n=1 Tax=Spea bombifrons TaxID=233779 RepID=UPI00234AC5AF|nr:leucine-rich repeat protein SHOC-2-like [Spea bombifrons]